MEEIAPDRKPGKWLSFYLPAALGALTAAFARTTCICEVTFSQALVEVTVGAIFAFFIWLSEFPGRKNDHSEIDHCACHS